MSNPETYREKGLNCARAANEAHGSGERVGLHVTAALRRDATLGLAIVYLALADDGRHEHIGRPSTRPRYTFQKGACREQQRPKATRESPPRRG
jgi:hypothetical protein